MPRKIELAPGCYMEDVLARAGYTELDLKVLATLVDVANFRMTRGTRKKPAVWKRSYRIGNWSQVEVLLKACRSLEKVEKAPP